MRVSQLVPATLLALPFVLLGAIAPASAAPGISQLRYEGVVTIRSIDIYPCLPDEDCPINPPVSIGQNLPFSLTINFQQPAPRSGGFSPYAEGLDPQGFVTLAILGFGENEFVDSFGSDPFISAKRLLTARLFLDNNNDVCGSGDTYRFFGRTFTASAFRCDFIDGHDPSYAIGGQGRVARILLNGAVVPEPATWSMMIAGFGLVGGALRHRRRSAVTAPAPAG